MAGFMPAGRSKMTEKMIAFIVKQPTKNHFRPYLSDKAGSIGLNIANPVKNIVLINAVNPGSVHIRS